MLTAHDLNAIQTMFPTSIGIRILIAGWAIVLFNSKTSLYASWNEGIAGTIGELDFDFDILDHPPKNGNNYGGC